jgi:hypothetical protein
MPKIFELFGYPLSSKSAKAEQTRKQALCPFYGGVCDGGGNRYLSAVKLPEHPKLARYFNDKKLSNVQVGVCSIQLTEEEAPWIVCPRRLLVLGHSQASAYQYQRHAEHKVLSALNYKSGARLGVWREVKIYVEDNDDNDDENSKSFDYTFDYVIMPVAPTPLKKIQESLGGDIKSLEKSLSKNGYTFALRNNEVYVENYPSGTPSILEIMTSSTSGGNEKKRTRISHAFEDAILGKPHNAPSINKRQVWARMASQLIVKSQAAVVWGGKTIWLLQDNLAHYISNSTALNLNDYIAEHTGEVNVLSFYYVNQHKTPANSIIELKDSKLFSGQMAPKGNAQESKSFQDIVRASFVPDINSLISRLASKRALRYLTAP